MCYFTFVFISLYSSDMYIFASLLSIKEVFHRWKDGLTKWANYAEESTAILENGAT